MKLTITSVNYSTKAINYQLRLVLSSNLTLQYGIPVLASLYNYNKIYVIVWFKNYFSGAVEKFDLINYNGS